MRSIEKYLRNYNIWFCNFDDLIILANRKFYICYIVENGLEIDLKSKDQQKVLLHYLLMEVCEHLKDNKEYKIVYYSNNWTTHDNYLNKFIKKIVRIFGITIFTEWMTFNDFLIKLQSFDVKFIEQFDLFIENRKKPKSLKQIKKFLEKEGFTDLINNYFQDVTNKMAICD